MRLARFSAEDGPRLAAVVDGAFVDLSQYEDLPRNPLELLGLPQQRLESLRDSLAGADRITLRDASLLAPVPRPSKFFAVGLNYADHVAESGVETPVFPILFAKMPSTVVGPFTDVWRPRVSHALDYEGELGLVIDVTAAMSAGIRLETSLPVTRSSTISASATGRCGHLNGLSGNRSTPDGPMGPHLVTGDEIDPHNLAIRTLV